MTEVEDVVGAGKTGAIKVVEEGEIIVE